MDGALTDHGVMTGADAGPTRQADETEDGIARQIVLFAMVAAAVAAWMVSGAGIVVLWLFCTAHLTALASTPIVGTAFICWIGTIVYGLRRLSL
jgi:hypothetical protein